MAYYVDVFTPETYRAFLESDRSVAGFLQRQNNLAAKLRPGDKLLCYVTRISRWVGVLEIKGKPFTDNTPIFVAANDPYTIRFEVAPVICLDLEKGIPAGSKLLWEKLSFTRHLKPGSSQWTTMVRSSLRLMNDKDGSYLEGVLKQQQVKPLPFPFTEADRRKLVKLTVRTQENEVSVSIPGNEDEPHDERSADVRESVKMQATLASIGEIMGMKIWLPANDRTRVLKRWKPKRGSLLDVLPVNFDASTLQTIENIDVLWISGREIVRAFEVEHTTSIYSGILRMADLMSLQPNIRINAHIVAPEERKEKVFREIRRPVFALLGKRPLSELCTFISYDSVIELSNTPNLEYTKDEVLEKYAESADEA